MFVFHGELSNSVYKFKCRCVFIRHIIKEIISGTPTHIQIFYVNFNYTNNVNM